MWRRPRAEKKTQTPSGRWRLQVLISARVSLRRKMHGGVDPALRFKAPDEASREVSVGRSRSVTPPAAMMRLWVWIRAN